MTEETDKYLTEQLRQVLLHADIGRFLLRRLTAILKGLALHKGESSDLDTRELA